MNNSLIITNEEIDNLLTWEKIVSVINQVFIALSSKNDNVTDKNVLTCVQTQRTFTHAPSGDGLLICMPSYLQGLNLGCTNTESTMACKLLTVFQGNTKRNPPLPSIDGVVMLYDGNTGIMKAMIDADQLTLWRTAAVTCAATKVLWGTRSSRSGQVLAIIGAGNQGRIHALAFYNQFKFNKIRIWNRTVSKAQVLVEELKKLGAPAVLCHTTMECVQGADVIITTTFSPQPLIQDDWVKGDAMVNAIGVVSGGSEISPEIYKRANVYVESKQSAEKELPNLTIEGDIGQVIKREIPVPPTDKIVVFQSLGSGVEDAAVGMLLVKLKSARCASN